MAVNIYGSNGVTVSSGGTIAPSSAGTVSLSGGGGSVSLTVNQYTTAGNTTSAGITGGVTTSVTPTTAFTSDYIGAFVVIEPYSSVAEMGVITGTSAIGPTINATFDRSHSTAAPLLIVGRSGTLQAEWFGMKEIASAAANSTALSYFTAAVINTTNRGALPAGEFDYSSTWTIVDASGITIKGAGSYVGGTRLRWRGSASGTGMLVEDCRENNFAGFRIYVDSVTYTLSYGIRSWNGSGSTTGPTQNRFTDIYIDNTSTGWMLRGVSIDDAGGGGDFNNDLHILDHVYVQRAKIGFYQDGNNIIQVKYYNCGSVGESDGWHTHAVYCLAGNFMWMNGGANYCADVDFYRTTNGASCMIMGHDSEHSSGFYHCDNGSGGASGANTPTFVSNVRWDRSSSTMAIRTSNYIAEDKTIGPLIISASYFFTKSTETPIFRMGTAGGNTYAVMELNGVTIDTDETNYADIFSVAEGRLYVRGCSVKNSGGGLDIIPDINTTATVNMGAARETSITSGAITFAQSRIKIDTESDAASDDLDTINGGRDGDMLYIRSAVTGRVTTVKHGTGNIILAGAADFAIDNRQDLIVLMYDSQLASWVEVSRANNGT